MTTDITELAPAMKAAAVRAQAATGEYASQRISSTAFRLEIEEFESLAHKPANVLALVEALEKAQAKNALVAGGIEASTKLHERIAELEEAEQKLCAANVTLDARAELAERLLAEMESRTVTVKLPLMMNLKIAGDKTTKAYFSGTNEGIRDTAKAFEAALTAAGIKWEAE
ncbi:MAG TPA: hypothetical protein DD675_25910 [Raoultella ornithinolytica]|nr:hypothetical protein [Raoultella ornithinolytica]